MVFSSIYRVAAKVAVFEWLSTIIFSKNVYDLYCKPVMQQCSTQGFHRHLYYYTQPTDSVTLFMWWLVLLQCDQLFLCALEADLLTYLLLLIFGVILTLTVTNVWQLVCEPGLMCELLWSDPQPQMGRSPSKRGVGIQFGPDVTHRFLRLNNLDYIIRSHEVKQEGYEVAHDGKCITVFSAPNYW